jgi:hypothetical protein
MKRLDGELAIMVFSVHLERSEVGTIVNGSVRGQFNSPWSLRIVALQ